MRSSHTNNVRPIVSEILADGTIVETIHIADVNRTEFVVCQPDGSITREQQVELDDGRRLVPISSATDLIATGCVLLPSDVGDFRDKGDLLADIKAYFHRYVDLSPAFEDIAAYYVLLTWVYDAFNELPYLRFRGDYGTGKTRALLTIGSICYKPFFASGASTVSPLFHVLNAFNGTMILDEADFRFSDATAELTKILNNGNMRGLPVLRTMTTKNRELVPQAFRVYGPKIIGMRESFNDRALESRFLTEETGRRSIRPDIPIHTPDALRSDALALRNKLLAWRFHARHLVTPDPSRVIFGIEPRLNQTALALLSLVDDEAVRNRLRDELVGHDTRARNDRASTDDATMLRALLDAFAASSARHVAVADAARRFNLLTSAEGAMAITAKKAGVFIRTRLRLTTVKTNGVYVVPFYELAKILALAQRFGVEVGTSSIYAA